MITTQCLSCGTSFQRRRDSRQPPRFCSMKCHAAAKVAARRQAAALPAVVGAVWIALGAGAFTLVDAADRTRVEQFRWCLGADGYARGRVEQRVVLLHRFLFADARELDHANRDRLDNRRANLRPATSQQNSGNRGLSATRNTSGFKGVSRNTVGGGWSARLRSKSLGTFATAEDAARAYDVAVRAAYGEFAYQNFPGDARVAAPMARARARVA